MLVPFEQNHMIRTIQNIELFLTKKKKKKKMVSHFGQIVDAILEDVSVTEKRRLP